MIEQEWRPITREELLVIIDQAAREGWTELNLYDLGISELPAEVGQLTNLKTLDLGYDENASGKLKNSLTELPYEIGQLTNLQALDLSYNQLTALPKTVGQLTCLQTLNLNHNQLTTLPEAIRQLTSLQKLNLTSNNLTALPEWIDRLTNLQQLDLCGNQLTLLPESISQLTRLQTLNLSHNQLTTLPKVISQLTNLMDLAIGYNQLMSLPDWIGQLTNLRALYLTSNQLTTLPKVISQLTNLMDLTIGHNQLMPLPDWIGQLTNLWALYLVGNQLTSLPEWIGQLTNLRGLYLDKNQLTSLPDTIGQLTQLRYLGLSENQLEEIPEVFRNLKKLKLLMASDCKLTNVPEWISELANLERLLLSNNQITDLPYSLAQLKHLEIFRIDYNPLNPALQSAYDAGLPELMAYLRSLEEAEPLYEAKLILVGEGGVGKTTLLKALTGREGEEPREGEPTTHGVQIDIDALTLPHPENDDVAIQLNAWDFGGQEVYRVTHQFFFSRRSLYLLVWEPRAGVQQCQVEDWLKLIRLRVGDDARVLIVSTHCKTGQRIARIDKPVFLQDFGSMIAGFYDVDSLVNDATTGEKVGIAKLKRAITQEAAKLEQMGMEIGSRWREARDELLNLSEPRISYTQFSKVCEKHELSAIATKTLAHLMHDLGYIVYYPDDENLRDDVVLQPQWLTKAIGFILEDRATQEMDGILPDDRLHEVWRDHHFKDEPRYEPELYPFFLRLMEKYDVSYRLPDGTASLVAQHVPQVRPELPWLPDHAPPDDARRIAMICTMDEAPPGLVPWMIVRTHDYAVEQACGDGNNHRLHWQKGMFLCHPPHGEAVLEQRGREFHLYTQAVYPVYFMNVLQHTLDKLITDNWPGLEGRYAFTVPCPEQVDDQPCKGRFDIHALRQFLAEGDETIRCQACRGRQSIEKLLHGFEERPVETLLRDIQDRLDGLDSRIANYVMALMRAIADEAKHGPRLFTVVSAPRGGVRDALKQRYRLHLWCEAEGCLHPVSEKEKGVYEFDAPRDWVRKVAPYANFALGLLKTALPLASPAVDAFFGKDTFKNWDYANHFKLASGIIGKVPKIETPDRPGLRPGILTEPERSGLLELHALLRELDPNQEKLGLIRVPTYTGDYRWLCREHYEAWKSKIPDKIE
ncbi:MAG: leucine-rich repeat domain-containing protein [Anaerolineae bacterium]|nr:leucine-rich repeat domain-containing protein [Anaerolineae bacterium]